MEAVMLIFRLVVIANWGWRIASHPTSRESFRRFKSGPRAATFRRNVTHVWSLRHKVARAWALSGRLLRRRRQPSRSLAIRR